jgi:hypothetical protein
VESVTVGTRGPGPGGTGQVLASASVTPTRERLVRAAPWAAAVALVATVLLAYLGKVVCVDGRPGWWAVTAYCYSDVHVLWSWRGFDVGTVPYAGAPAGYPVDYTVEYPPGLMFPAWLLALIADSRRMFFDLHAVTFAVAAAVTLWQCDRALRTEGAPGWARSRVRLLGFALSPTVVLFGMQNWDLWSVAVVACGIAAASRGRSGTAAIWFGLGAAVKWWPALLVPLLMVGRWAPRRPAGRWRLPSPLLGADLRPAAIAAAAWTAIQIPALLVSPAGWWGSIQFHLRRGPNLDSTAAVIQRAATELLGGAGWVGVFSTVWTVVSLLALAGGVAYVMVRLRSGTLGPGDAALAVVALFLLTGKVLSPQFVLWLLPVAVVAGVRWAPMLAVEAANAGVWLMYGPWLARGGEPGFNGFLTAAQGTSIVRTLTLGWLVAAALIRTEERTRTAADPRGRGGDEARADTADRAG